MTWEEKIKMVSLTPGQDIAALRELQRACVFAMSDDGKDAATVAVLKVRTIAAAIEMVMNQMKEKDERIEFLREMLENS